MKKFCFFVGLIICCFGFVGCSSNKNFQNRISEKDEILLSQEDDNFFVTLCIGKRENPYIVDGKNGEMIDFAVLTAYGKTEKVQNGEAKFKINVNGIEKNGIFEVNPFDGSFVVDLLNVGNEIQQAQLVIEVASNSYSYKLTSALSEGCISADEALAIAEKEFKKVEKQLTNDDKNSFEVYVRLMQNPGQIPLFYVSAINEEDQLFALIIDPTTKEVIAKNFK